MKSKNVLYSLCLKMKNCKALDSCFLCDVIYLQSTLQM